ncbi:MAG: hypothetical protein AAF604_19815 [Acidobacteriota bacterium]
MSKTWQDSEIKYLNRYAKTKTFDELVQRFDVAADQVTAKLLDLGLTTKDGKPEQVAADPLLAVYEDALERLYKEDWKKASALLEKIISESDQPELAERARQLLGVAERRLAAGPKEEDPFLLAVWNHNRGDHQAALALCEEKDRLKKDERFLYLAAAVKAASGDEAAGSLLEQAVEMNPKNRVYAFHDSDFDDLRATGDYAHLFELE